MFYSNNVPGKFVDDFEKLYKSRRYITAKHDLRPILTCRTRNSATQKLSATATAHNFLF